ncbi:MAG: hypothetical protein HQ589_05185, partial [Syntrophaceae bacterium]|nr:hypothetical protein [Syntrophaceae bacterium]
MFKRKRMKRTSTDIKIRVVIATSVLESIFDECDKHDINETGGRIIGYYRAHNNELQIDVRDVIDSGPKARRTPTSFFQDGEYQESVFRQIESKHPSIEHLGNWHTHHVNGVGYLSTGDVATYNRTVNHRNHNTDFFYALLVVAKNNCNNHRNRYKIKHFLLRRGDPKVYEIPASQVKIIKEPSLCVEPVREYDDSHVSPSLSSSNTCATEIGRVRAKDKQFLAEMYPDLKPFISKKLRNLYW